MGNHGVVTGMADQPMLRRHAVRQGPPKLRKGAIALFSVRQSAARIAEVHHHGRFAIRRKHAEQIGGQLLRRLSSEIGRRSSGHPSPAPTGKPPRQTVWSGPWDGFEARKFVTTPKLPQPPRSAQYRPLFSPSLTFCSLPSAVTRSKERTLSQAKPCLRASRPMPPAPKSAPPPRHAPRCPLRQCDSKQGLPRYTWLKTAPGPTCTTPASGAHPHEVHPLEVDHQAAVAHRVAVEAVSAAPHRGEQISFTGEVDRLDHIRGAFALQDQARSPVDGPVPHPPGLCVANLPPAPAGRPAIHPSVRR